MFILIPIAINSSLTSKRAHVCIVTAIVASLMISWYLSNFSSDCSYRVLKRQREGEGIEDSIPLCDAYFSLHKHYFANPNDEDARK